MERDEKNCQIDSEMKKAILAHSHQIFHFCYHLTGNRMDAEDLFQDTFLAAWEKRDVLCNQISDSQMKNYLLGIATHLWKNHQRKWFRRNRIAPPDGREDALAEAVSTEQGPEGNLLQKEIWRELRCRVEALPDKFRLVIVMHYAGEMSTEEIAVQLGIPAATVRSRLNRARKKLLKELEENGYERLYG